MKYDLPGVTAAVVRKGCRRKSGSTSGNRRTERGYQRQVYSWLTRCTCDPVAQSNEMQFGARHR